MSTSLRETFAKPYTGFDYSSVKRSNISIDRSTQKFTLIIQIRLQPLIIRSAFSVQQLVPVSFPLNMDCFETASSS